MKKAQKEERPYILFPRKILDNILSFPLKSLKIWLFIKYYRIESFSFLLSELDLTEEEYYEEMRILTDLNLIRIYKNGNIRILSGQNIKII